MFLRIAVPDDWTTTAVDDGHVHQIGDTSIHASRIRELPVDPSRWMHHAALLGAPAGTKWTERSRAELQTVDGWNALLREIALEHVEYQRVRIVVLYQFLDYAAGATVDVHASWYDAQRADLIDMLGSARPDWGPQELTCLANLFGGAHRHVVTLK